MANDQKLDNKDILGIMKWDLDKAKYLLADIQKYFDCPDLQYPPRESIDTIKYEFEHVAIMMALLSDVIEKLTNTLSPML